MIIICNNCSKKFEVNSDLISDNGRLLQCSGCNHKWFFKKEVKTTLKKIKPIETKNLDVSLFDEQEINGDLNQNHEHNPQDIKKINKIKKGKSKFLQLTLISIISFIALIILVDTFEVPISKIIPNIEFILYNLYESIKDIMLFFEDLI
jgi:predicted Zn finger-like uncharacterized protein|tara:strand:+ start:114 stop:560 length:447 start_codon:yes stop_codon:yes gene_type:complete